jgi:adenylate cyclase
MGVVTALRQRSRPLLMGVMITSVFLWWQFASPPSLQAPLERLEALAYDLRLNLTLATRGIDPRVVIVDINEKSLEEMGQWPWPRDRIATLVDKLFAQGAVVVGFDIVFPEAERNSAQNIIGVLQQQDGGTSSAQRQEIVDFLQQQMERFDNNRRLAEAFSDRDVVLGYVYDYRDGAPVGLLPEPPLFTNRALALQALPVAATNYTANLPLLQRATPFAGFFSLLPDRDGIIRRAPLLARIGDNIYPSLSVEILRAFYLADEININTALINDQPVIESISIDKITIPTDRQGNAIVPYRGGWGSFPYIGAADVLTSTVADKRLDGAIVLLGTTAHGLFDLRTTPIESIYPGVEVHANLIAGALDQRFPSKPAWAEGADFLTISLAGLLLSLLLPFLSPLRMVLASFVTASALVGFNFWIWQQSLFILSLALPFLMILTISVANLAYGFLHEAYGRRELKNRFGQYVPPELVDRMNDNPDAAYGFDGEAREMTVLFCDIRNFTTISESMDAAALKQMLNRFFSPMTRIIFDHHGTIDKYVGDMIMAFWGAPLRDEEHALHAVEAALAMLQMVDQLNRQRPAEEGLPQLRVGIGINSGVMNVGDMGSEYRRAYTVLGDAVNQGSRLEALTKFYGVTLLIGEQTQQQIASQILCREVDRVQVKGKREAVQIFEPLGHGAQIDESVKEELSHYHQALDDYRQQSWDSAEQTLQRLQQQKPHPLYQLYLERIARFRERPPAKGWGGVYQHTQKEGGE